MDAVRFFVPSSVERASRFMSNPAVVSGRPIRVTVWGEAQHEKRDPQVAKLYPEGMHATVAAGISKFLGDAAQVRTATLDDPEHGLTEEVLADTDVLTWWGHMAHGKVDDAVVDRVHEHVLGGMGLIPLHSAHFSKIFRKLMGTTCSLRWRNDAERELVWTVKPGHPIAAGIPSPLIVDAQEMYGELFDIPQPDELVFISSFPGGEVFRSGCVFYRGKGRIFYFSPGDQEYPVYHNENIQHVIANAVAWAAQPDVERSAPQIYNSKLDWFLQN
jgi:trehalose utilization protein